MINKKTFFNYFIAIIIINSLFFQIDFKIDLTDDKKHSISKETKHILEKLDDIVFIKIYLDGDFPTEFKYLQSELINLLNSFKTISGSNFEFEFINPNQTNNEKEKADLFKQLVKNGLSPTDIEIRTSSVNQVKLFSLEL